MKGHQLLVTLSLVTMTSLGLGLTAVEAMRLTPMGQEIIGPAENYTCVENGAWPHEELCEYYYDCWEGLAMLGRCTEGYLFDLTYMGCNFPEQVDCDDRIRPNGTDPTTTTTTTKSTTTTDLPGTGPTDDPTDPEPTDPPGEFECPSASGLFPDPDDCSSFFQCDNFVATHQQCPDPLVFNPIGYCDYIENVPECQDF